MTNYTDKYISDSTRRPVGRITACPACGAGFPTPAPNIDSTMTCPVCGVRFVGPAVVTCPVCGKNDFPEGGMHAARAIHMWAEHPDDPRTPPRYGDKGVRVVVPKTTQEKELEAKLEQAQNELHTMRLLFAMSGLGGDPGGFYADTPGFELRMLRTNAAGYKAMLPQIEDLRDIAQRGVEAGGWHAPMFDFFYKKLTKALEQPTCNCPWQNGYHRDAMFYGHHIACPFLQEEHTPSDQCGSRGHQDGSQGGTTPETVSGGTKEE